MNFFFLTENRKGALFVQFKEINLGKKRFSFHFSLAYEPKIERKCLTIRVKMRQID